METRGPHFCATADPRSAHLPSSVPRNQTVPHREPASSGFPLAAEPCSMSAGAPSCTAPECTGINVGSHLWSRRHWRKTIFPHPLRQFCGIFISYRIFWKNWVLISSTAYLVLALSLPSCFSPHSHTSLPHPEICLRLTLAWKAGFLSLLSPPPPSPSLEWVAVSCLCPILPWTPHFSPMSTTTNVCIVFCRWQTMFPRTVSFGATL